MKPIVLVTVLATILCACTDDFNLPKEELIPHYYSPGKHSVSTIADWLTEPGRLPSIDIELKNEDCDTITEHLKLVVETDMKESYTVVSDSITVPFNETAQKKLTFQAEPGFYNCTLMVEDSVVFKKTIGHAPTQIKAEPDYQDDFDEFWSNIIANISSQPVSYTLTPAKKYSTELHEVFRINIKSTPDLSSKGKPTTISGYLSVPKSAGKHPALLHIQSLAKGGESPWPDDIEGFCRLELYMRGQFYDMENPYEDWISFGLQDKDTYYYKNGVEDILIALKILKSMDFVDPNNIFAAGGSQGGALSVAAAAFDHSVNCIAITIPFLGDFKDSAKISFWPAQSLIESGRFLGLSQEETFKTLSYFDAKNWATKVECPVLMEFSLQDPFCPPRTTMAIYNNLINCKEKTYNCNPTNAHAPSPHFQADYEVFFRKHLR